MTERVVGAWRRAWPRVMVMALIVFSLGTCVNFVLIGVTMHAQGLQAAQGTAARVTQCKTRPITVKKEDWFHASGVTSRAERDAVIDALPSERECSALLADEK